MTGAAVIGICPRAFFVEAFGSARERPTMTLGMIGDLEDLLRDLRNGARHL